VDIAHGEHVEKELDLLITRRDEKRRAEEGERRAEEMWAERAALHPAEAGGEPRRAVRVPRGSGRPHERRPRGAYRLPQCAGAEVQRKRTPSRGGFMFFTFDPEVEIERLKAEFQEGKARIWADENMPLEEKSPAIDRLWREFDRQRKELQSASQGPPEATEQEEGYASPKTNLTAFLPRRRIPRWK
jgi:hypothetical protein